MAVHDEQTKAAVMAALLEGQSVSSVAKKYEIPKGTVSDWKRKVATTVEVGGSDEKPTQKGNQGSIGNLLMTLLETNVRSLIAISEKTADPEWLDKQTASEVSLLFGVKHDKVVRMIEALNGSDAEGS